jgi:hypothetical protein
MGPIEASVTVIKNSVIGAVAKRDNILTEAMEAKHPALTLGAPKT